MTNHTKLFEKSTQSIKQSLETIEINSQWQAKNYKNIGRYLQDYSKKWILFEFPRKLLKKH